MKKLLMALSTLIAAAPAHAAYILGGVSGSADIRVTSGTFKDYQGLGAPKPPTISVDGYRGRLTYSVRTYADVYRTYDPFTEFDPYVVVSASISLFDPLSGKSFYSFGIYQTNSEPDPGQAYESATFKGDGEAGRFGSYFNENSGSLWVLDLAYSQAGAAGTGSFIDEYEVPVERQVRFGFNILSGTAHAVVPEPSAWALLIIGFGAIGGAMRRRGAAAAAFKFA